MEISGTHNPEVAGSSPAPATIKTAVFDKKTAVFLTFWGHTLPTFLLKGRGESLGLFFLRLYSRGLCELSGTSGKMIVQKKKWVRFSKKFQARKGQKAETGSRKQLIHAAETARFILLKYVWKKEAPTEIKTTKKLHRRRKLPKTMYFWLLKMSELESYSRSKDFLGGKTERGYTGHHLV